MFQLIAKNVTLRKDNASDDKKEACYGREACMNLAARAGAFSTAAGAALPLDAEPGTHPDAAAPVTPIMLVSRAFCLPFHRRTCAGVAGLMQVSCPTGTPVQQQHQHQAVTPRPHDL